MYIVTRSATQGRVAGLVSVAGIHLGTMVHVAAAMLGLSAVLATSATAFTAVKLVGAAYLIWLGVQSLRSYRVASDEPAKEQVMQQQSLRRTFADGFLVNLLNPKTAIFFLSFVPQFVDQQASSPALRVALLGAIFIGLGMITDSIYAFAGGMLGGRLRNSPSLQRRKDLVAGTTYVGLGLVTALSGYRAD